MFEVRFFSLKSNKWFNQFHFNSVKFELRYVNKLTVY